MELLQLLNHLGVEAFTIEGQEAIIASETLFSAIRSTLEKLDGIKGLIVSEVKIEEESAMLSVPPVNVIDDVLDDGSSAGVDDEMCDSSNLNQLSKLDGIHVQRCSTSSRYSGHTKDLLEPKILGKRTPPPFQPLMPS